MDAFPRTVRRQPASEAFPGGTPARLRARSAHVTARDDHVREARDDGVHQHHHQRKKKQSLLWCGGPLLVLLDPIVCRHHEALCLMDPVSRDRARCLVVDQRAAERDGWWW